MPTRSPLALDGARDDDACDAPRRESASWGGDISVKRLEGERVHGPYPHRSRWRVVLVGGNGDRERVSFDTEAEARRFKAAKLKELAGRTVEEAVREHLTSMRERGCARARSVGRSGTCAASSSSIGSTRSTAGSFRSGIPAGCSSRSSRSGARSCTRRCVRTRRSTRIATSWPRRRRSATGASRRTGSRTTQRSG